MNMGIQVDSKTESSSSQSRPAADEAAERDYQEASEAVRRIPQLLAILRERALYYLSLRIGLLRARARSAVWLLVIGAMMLLILATGIVTSIVLLLTGVGHGLGDLFGGRYWLGDVIVGAGAVGLFWYALKVLIAGAHKQALDEARRICEEQKRFRTVASSSDGAGRRQKPSDSAASDGMRQTRDDA